MFTSPWFDVRRDEVIRPDGSPSLYDHVVAPGSVTVLAVDADGAVAVTRQWIYVHEATQWRLPTGGIQLSDRDPAQAARRELAEETGLCAAVWIPLGTIQCGDSFTNQREHAFLATGLSQGQARLSAGESDLRVHRMPFPRLLAMVLAGELPHAGSTFAALKAHATGLFDAIS